MPKHALISVREDTHPSSVCASCENDWHLVEIRIGNVIYDVCRDCFSELTRMVDPQTEVEKKLADMTRQAKMWEELYRCLYMSSEKGEDMQSTVGALSGIWTLLNVEDQTAAIGKIKRLLEREDMASRLKYHDTTGQ
jgi:hypothetical protein